MRARVREASLLDSSLPPSGVKAAGGLSTAACDSKLPLHQDCPPYDGSSPRIFVAQIMAESAAHSRPGREREATVSPAK